MHRVKLKKRASAHLSPGRGRFHFKLIFGDRTIAAVRSSNLPEAVLKALDEAPRYAEGTGLRFVVSKSQGLLAIRKLALVKPAN